MRYFGINRVPDDLPRLSEFEGILNAQSLIPQMDQGGEAHVSEIGEPDPEQLSLGMGRESRVGSRESGEENEGLEDGSEDVSPYAPPSEEEAQ
jgi:hypothetical protein